MNLKCCIGLGLGGLCALLAVWLWLTGFRLDRAQEQAEQWERSAKAGQAALLEMQSTYEAMAKALTERDRQVEEINKTLATQRKALKETRNDKTVVDWGRTPVPDAVSGLLKGRADACGNSPANP